MNHDIDTLDIDDLDERAALVHEARAILAGEIPGGRTTRDHVAALLSMLDGSAWPPSPLVYGQLPLSLPAVDPVH